MEENISEDTKKKLMKLLERASDIENAIKEGKPDMFIAMKFGGFYQDILNTIIPIIK